MNNLANEVSPYLQQHKDNPVHWQAWSQETLQIAIDQDKPILLSIGYSACHWCHVMEHESFEKKHVADVMNAYFLNIKIDREERPDIDMIYMEAIQQMGLHGGWPLHVFLLPNQKPFYGGTYFPQKNWLSILQSIHEAFQNNRKELEASAEGFAQGMQHDMSVFHAISLNEIPQIIPRLMERVKSALDPVFGGVQKAPKFPLPSLIRFIEAMPPYEAMKIHFHTCSDNQLLHMAQGGIFDQLGGGFSRYSVDSEWFCPHFEKMLYDNAQLLLAYALAYRRNPLPIYKEVILQTLSFLENELKGPNGIFYSALDADSEGTEGAYYTWTFDELTQILPLQDHRDFYEAYQILPKGNWEQNQNILFKSKNILNSRFDFENNMLRSIRANRIPPQTDTKQILSWNAMMVSAYVEIAYALEDVKYAVHAEDLLNTIHQIFYSDSFWLHQSAFSNDPISAFLDDLACLQKAYLDVYLQSGTPIYLDMAHDMANLMIREHQGDLFFKYVGSLGEQLIADKYELIDSVCPSSNSILCENFLWLGYLSDQVEWTGIGKDMLEKIIDQAQTNPIYYANWLRIYAEWFEFPKALIKFDKTVYAKVDLIKLDWPVASSMIQFIPSASTDFMICFHDHCLQPVKSMEELKLQLETLI